MNRLACLLLCAALTGCIKKKRATSSGTGPRPAEPASEGFAPKPATLRYAEGVASVVAKSLCPYWNRCCSQAQRAYQPFGDVYKAA
jgi:hypothetical protein